MKTIKIDDNTAVVLVMITALCAILFAGYIGHLETMKELEIEMQKVEDTTYIIEE